MNKINVPRISGFAILDGKHNAGGPLDIPVGGFGEILFEVKAGDDMGFLSLNREMTHGLTAQDLFHTELVNAGGTSIAASDQSASNAPSIYFDTETKSRMVNKLAPGHYAFRITDKTGKAHTGVVFSLLQTIAK